MMNVPIENIRVGDTSLRDHYEDVAATTLRSMGRWKYLIAAYVLGAIVLAALLVSVLPRTYTAEALLYPSMSSPEDQNDSVSASVSGTALVRSEAERIESQPIAARVVKRLGLDTNPAFLSVPSGLEKLRHLRSIIMPETVHNTRLARAVARLQSRLQVRSDTRTYVIAVRYTAASPELAANIANAVLLEYQRSKENDRKARDIRTARDELVKLSAVYGKRHPSVVQAENKLANAKRELQLAVDDPGGSDADLNTSEWMVRAEPNTTPSGPAGSVILGVASIFGLIAGVCAAIWHDRSDNGFTTSNEVAARTSTRCVGLVPKIRGKKDPASAVQLPSIREALRAIAVGAGLDGSKGVNKVVMVTTIESPEDAARFTEALGRVLVGNGQRVLFVNAGPATDPANGAGEELIRLDDVVAEEECAQAFFEANKDNKMALLNRAGETMTEDDRFAIRSVPLSRFLAAAREYYDFVLIASPLVLHPSDTALIGRESDVRLFAARWNRTPREAVISAIKRLCEFEVQVNGVVLTDVDVVKYHRRGADNQRLELA